MKTALAGPLDRARSLLSTISVGQKVVIGLLGIGLLLGGVFFYRWITAPTYAPLFSNLSSSDASAIVDQLNTAGESYTLTDGGATINVPKDDVYAQRLAMSGQGLPAGDDTGYALLDQQGITTSEFQQQTTYQRALEGELAKTLEALKGVNAAVVHLAIPKDAVFTDDQGKATASVLLKLRPGSQLSGEQIQSVTNLVSSSVEKMDAKDVTVTDSEGHVLAAAGTGPTAGGSGAQSQAEADAGSTLAARAQQVLDRVAGPGNAIVSVSADLDFSQRASTSETYSYTPNTPALSESQDSEQYNGNGTPTVGGVLGPENQPTTATGDGSSTYNKASSTTNNAVDKTTETVQAAVGDPKRLTVAVVLNSSPTGGVALDPTTIQSVVSTAVGLDATRGDAITVASMPFDTTSAQQAKADLAAAQAAEASARMWSLVKTGAIVLGVLVLVLLVWLRSRRGRPELVDDDYDDQLELTDEHLLELERLRVESSRDAAIDARRIELEGAHRERVRGEISEMISDRPDEVAVMLRSWFAESSS